MHLALLPIAVAPALLVFVHDAFEVDKWWRVEGTGGRMMAVSIDTSGAPSGGRGPHWRDRKPGQPFFAVFNNMTTHESQIFKSANRNLMHDPARAMLPRVTAANVPLSSARTMGSRMPKPHMPSSKAAASSSSAPWARGWRLS